jgi:ABC-type glycerol-3-phosphate transport system permease component
MGVLRRRLEVGLGASDTDEQKYYRRRAKVAERGKQFSRLLIWVLLVVGALAFMMPLYLMLTMSLKTPAELATTSEWAWPQNPTLDNFRQVIQNPFVPFATLFQNTLVITVLTTLGTLLSSALVAYAFARMQFRGRDRLFILVLSTMMLPGLVLMIPTYILYAKLQWVNTFYPLIVPAWFGGGAFNIFLLRQFFMTLPRELDEAAVLDGAGHWTIFSRIIMPLSVPALVTVGLFSFVFHWRDFMGPLLYLNDPNLQTLEVGLQTYRTMNNNEWHLIMAGATLVTIPLIVIFFLGQRYFVKGIALTGGK